MANMVMGEIERLDPPRRLGNVTLLATLGEGGMATVYLASVGQENLARLAAVKLLRPGLPDHDYRTRFMDEAKLVLRLHHNNIVDVREAGEIDGQLFIVMALYEGESLKDRIARAPLRLPEIVDLGMQIAEGQNDPLF